MAQERAELTGNWRAEMEVERARMLKEMSGGGSRRPSYCKELEDLREEAPDEGEPCLFQSFSSNLSLTTFAL